MALIVIDEIIEQLMLCFSGVMGATSLSLVLWLTTLVSLSKSVVLPRPPATNLFSRGEAPAAVTSSDLPKQIPAPPPPPPAYASTPHYEQQLARLLWVTNTPYPVYQQWK